MYRIGRYDADDRMCDLVCDRYPVLLVMSRFGIALGFSDKTIDFMWGIRFLMRFLLLKKVMRKRDILLFYPEVERVKLKL